VFTCKLFKKVEKNVSEEIESGEVLKWNISNVCDMCHHETNVLHSLFNTLTTQNRRWIKSGSDVLRKSTRNWRFPSHYTRPRAVLDSREPRRSRSKQMFCIRFLTTQNRDDKRRWIKLVRMCYENRRFLVDVRNIFDPNFYSATFVKCVITILSW